MSQKNGRRHKEIPLPAGAALPPSAHEITIERQTDQNRMAGELRSDRFRRDGDLFGELELAFRTAWRSGSPVSLIACTD